MKRFFGARSINSLVIASLLFADSFAFTLPHSQETKSKDERGLGVRPNSNTASNNQTNKGGNKPEIVLQAGISSPQLQIAFSPDGRLLGSMSKDGNSLKLWEVSSGRVLRQIESAIPSMTSSSLNRPFRFSPDGRTIIAIADGSVRRWDVETGGELSDTILPRSRELMSAALSEDGNVFAGTHVNDGAIRVWDTTSGRELRAPSLDKDERLAGNDAIALSPDGRLLAILTETVKVSRKGAETTFEMTLWEVTSGRKAQTLKVSSAPMSVGVNNAGFVTLGFSHDGAWIAMRDDSTTKIWEVASGRELKSISIPTGVATSPDPGLAMFANRFLISPDRKLISMISEGRKINVVDAATATTIQTLTGHEGGIVGLAFSADSKLFATTAVDNQIKLWDVSNGRELRSFSGGALPVSDLAFSADGKTLAVAGRSVVNSWELTTGGVRRVVDLPDEYARPRPGAMLERPCLLSRDGRFAIAGSRLEPRAKVWETATGRELSTVSLTQGKELGNASFTSDGTVVALVEKNNQNPFHPVAQQTPQAPAPMPQQPMAMPDLNKMMEQMRKDPKKMQEQMKKIEEAMKKGDFSAGLSVLDSMGVMPPSTKPANKGAGSLRLIDVSSGRQLQSIALPSNYLNDMMADTIMSSSVISFRPDGRMLASATGFGAPISLRDVTTGQELRTLKPSLTMSVYGLAWSADGKSLASAHYGTKRNIADPNSAKDFTFYDLTFTIKLWNPLTGTELKSFEGHKNFVNSMAFSRDGRFLASGSYDSTIKIWDLNSGRELRTLKGHSAPIAAIDFSADGRFVVSGSEDGSTRLWNSQSGELLVTMVSLNKGDDWLVVTPDGLFDGSPGGWNQILWRFSPNTFDVSPVEIFFNEYFHPGLLTDILAGKKVTATADISQKDRRQPKLSIATDNPGSQVSTRTLKVKINVTDAPAGAQDVRLFRNGSLVKVWRGDVLKGQSSTTLEATISIVSGLNQLSAYAFNRDNVKSSDATLGINGADSLKRPATLHIIAIGLNEYANAGYNLKYAGADARAFAEEVERQQRKLGVFGQIELTSLYDKDATKANILGALRRLSGSDAKLAPGSAAVLEKIKPAEPEDAVVVFYAGHGTAQNQRFYFIPHDLGYSGSRTELDETSLKAILSHSISDLELEEACEGIDAGHLLMVIDACNSGQALEAEEKRRGPMNSKGLAQLAYEKGMYILTAAQSYQAAMEAEQLGHGYLTYALVEEGLKSAAADDQPKDGKVVLREWLDYATERVPGMQEAKMKAGRGLKHPVAFVEGEEKVDDVDKRSVQRPRVFYRREPESQLMIIAKP